MPCLACRYLRLSTLTFMHHVNHAIVSTLDFLRICPRGMKEVSNQLALKLLLLLLAYHCLCSRCVSLAGHANGAPDAWMCGTRAGIKLPSMNPCW
jgi:hypothetical protein